MLQESSASNRHPILAHTHNKNAILVENVLNFDANNNTDDRARNQPAMVQIHQLGWELILENNADPPLNDDPVLFIVYDLKINLFRFIYFFKVALVSSQTNEEAAKADVIAPIESENENLPTNGIDQ